MGGGDESLPNSNYTLEITIVNFIQFILNYGQTFTPTYPFLRTIENLIVLFIFREGKCTRRESARSKTNAILRITSKSETRIEREVRTPTPYPI